MRETVTVAFGVPNHQNAKAIRPAEALFKD
jgi:hypothetical protein